MARLEGKCYHRRQAFLGLEPIVKRLVMVLLLAVVVLAAGGYLYLTKHMKPRTLPPAVLKAEEALAVQGTVLVGHIDLEYAVRIDRTLRGKEDPLAFLNPEDKDSLIGLLAGEGIDIRDSVGHLIGALTLVGDEPGKSLIALGSFPVDAISRALSKGYIVEQKSVRGRSVLVVTKQDVETCKLSDPYAVHITQNRIVVATTNLIEKLLDRLDSNAEAEIDLQAWKKFRTGKMFSVGFFLPSNLKNFAKTPFVKRAALSAAKKLEPVERMFGGVSVQAIPPAAKFEATVETNDPGWVQQTVSEFKAEKTRFKDKFAQDLPTLARLERYAMMEARGQVLDFSVTLNREFTHDLGKAAKELGILALSGITGSKPQSPSAGPAAKEVLEKPGNIVKFQAKVIQEHLQPFTEKDQNVFFKSDVEAGPFGIRVKALKLKEQEDKEAQAQQVVEVELQARSNFLPNIGVESMHETKGAPQAELFVSRILDSSGQELLRTESCGKDRNSVGGILQPKPSSLYINNQFVQRHIFEGVKAIRLKPKASHTDIRRLEGSIILNLPVGVETRLVEAPFGGKVVETPGVRLLFKQAGPSAVRYDISGKASHALAVRALNQAKEFLAGNGASAMGRIVGRGKSVEKRFKGKPAFVEVVVANKIAVQEYPFTLDSVTPKFDEWTWPKPYTVHTSNKKAFLARYRRFNKMKGCGGNPPSRKLRPFSVCAESFRPLFGQIVGQVKVSAPNAAEIRGNASSVEVHIESLNIKGATKRRRIKFQEYAYFSPSSSEETLEDYVSVNVPDPDREFSGKEITGIGGRLVVLLPRRITKMTLDMTRLGNEVAAKRGLRARLIAFEDGRAHLEITGRRYKLLQFVPRGKDNAVLATNNINVSATETKGKWLAKIQISGTPKVLDIVYARRQDVLQYRFNVPTSR